MKHVFVSHASEDRGIATRICEALEREAIGCWIAPRDIAAGQTYARAITEGIESTRVFLCVFSANASASPHVRNEIESAASLGATMLVCRIDPSDPARDKDIGLFVRRHQWFDAYSRDLAASLAELVVAVRRVLDDSRRQRQSHGDREAVGSSKRTAKRGSFSTKPSLKAIGIDVGSTKIRACVQDPGAPQHAASGKAYLEVVRRPASPGSLVAQIKSMVNTVLENEKLDHKALAGIGVAVPGQVDLRAGVLKFGPGLGVRNVPVRTALASAFPGVPIRVDNDARCATRCELHAGAGRDFESFACIFVGTGVGSSFVINRQLVFGHNYCAGEIGHMKIASGGPICTCGQTGCLEAFTNGPAIVSRAKAKAIDWESRGLDTMLTGLGDRLNSQKIVDALEGGDAAAREVIEEVAEKLGLGIANCINVANPAAVVLGGGVMTGYFLHMINGITHAVQKNAIAEAANTPLLQSEFSDDGPAIGAAMMFHTAENWVFG